LEEDNMESKTKMICGLCELEIPAPPVGDPIKKEVEGKEHYFCCTGCVEAYLKEVEFRDFDLASA
jgi:hypothetical protein